MYSIYMYVCYNFHTYALIYIMHITFNVHLQIYGSTVYIQSCYCIYVGDSKENTAINTQDILHVIGLLTYMYIYCTCTGIIYSKAVIIQWNGPSFLLPLCSCMYQELCQSSSSVLWSIKIALLTWPRSDCVILNGL